MENTINKLKQAEDDDEKKIEELQTLVKDRFDETFDTELEKFATKVENKVNDTVSSTSTTPWKGPFVVFVVVISAASVLLYKKYQELRKSHLL